MLSPQRLTLFTTKTPPTPYDSSTFDMSDVLTSPSLILYGTNNADITIVVLRTVTELEDLGFNKISIFDFCIESFKFAVVLFFDSFVENDIWHEINSLCNVSEVSGFELVEKKDEVDLITAVKDVVMAWRIKIEKNKKETDLDGMNVIRQIALPQPNHRNGTGYLMKNGVGWFIVATNLKVLTLNPKEWNLLQIDLLRATGEASSVHIISIEAYNDYPTGNPVLFFATAQSGNATVDKIPGICYVLNIYGSTIGNSNWTWDDICADRDIITIEYAPLLLKHLILRCDTGLESCVLCPGTDNEIHIYHKNGHSYVEAQKDIYFPELNSIKTNVLSLDIVYIDEDFESKNRISVYGSQDGVIFLVICTDGLEFKIYKKHFDGPITSVKLFSFFHEVSNQTQWNLIVGGAIGYCVVFENILEDQFENGTLLPESTTADSVMVVDYRIVHNHVQVLIGTYGQKLLAYELTLNGDKYYYELIWTELFPHPVYSFSTGSFTGINKNEILLTTMFGVHLLQEKRHSVRKLREKIDLLVRLSEQNL